MPALRRKYLWCMIQPRFLHFGSTVLSSAVVAIVLVSCTTPGASADTAAVQRDQEQVPVYDDAYLDPTGSTYMTGPTRVHYCGPEDIHMSDAEFEAFQGQLQGFLETNNSGEFRRHFTEFYVPETFATDSLLDLYVTMYFRWDSIGVTNRFDHWWVRYVSPFAEGDTYDIALAEVRMRHHQVFQKRWTGNYRNFGRTFEQRYPGATIEYMDTTFVEANGDTALHRLISVEADRLVYLVRGQGTDSIHDTRIRLLNDGWQLSPEMSLLMDSAAVAFVEDHQRQFGRLEERPTVTGR
jgi:hypothetical protein